jgi:hypothetical protein
MIRMLLPGEPWELTLNPQFCSWIPIKTAVAGGIKMEWLMRLRFKTILTAGMFIMMAGCAGAPIDKTMQAEELLGTAGFQLKMADKPEALERINRIPQKQVVRGMFKDREVYVWADAAGCKCYYLGSRKNFEEMVRIQQENRAQYRINLYDAQDNDPLWGNPADWEDDLLGWH